MPEIPEVANDKLRDQFAGLAMHASIMSVRLTTTTHSHHTSVFNMDQLGVESYRVADIMMGARGEPG